MSDYWKRARDCYAGEKVIHDEGETYLPKLDRQSESQYLGYKKRARFFNGMRRTVDGLVGIVFRKDPVVNAEGLDSFTMDVSLNQQDINDYCQSVMQEALTTAGGGTLVDHPEEVEGLTVAAAEKLNLRPMFKYYIAENVKNWRYETNNNVSKLVEVILEEYYEDNQGNERKMTRQLLLEDGVYFQLLTKETGEGQETVERIDPKMGGKSIDFIPFVFHRTKTGLKYELPVLTDLCDTNIHHYQLEADHMHALRYVALPTPYVIGAEPPEDGASENANDSEGSSSQQMAIGPYEIWFIPNESAKVGMLEFTGAGLSAVREQLKKIESQMAQQGAKVLMPEENTAGHETATAALIGSKGETSLLARVTKVISSELTTALRYAAKWMGEAKLEDFSIELNTDFKPVGMTAQDLTALVQAWQSGAISHETLFDRLKEGEIIDGDREYDEEADGIVNNDPIPKSDNNLEDDEDEKSSDDDDSDNGDVD